MVVAEPVMVMAAAAGCKVMGLMTTGVPPVTIAAAAAGLSTDTEMRTGVPPATGRVSDPGTIDARSVGAVPVTVIVATAGVMMAVPAVDGVPPVIVTVAPVVTNDMVSIGAEPLTVISAPVRLPPGGLTIRSSVGAVPVTVALAAAGVRTVVVTSDGAVPVTETVDPEVLSALFSFGAVPVTVTLAPAGVSVVVVAELRRTLADAHALATLSVAPNVSVDVASLIARHPQLALGLFRIGVRFIPPVAELITAIVLPLK